MTAHDVAAGYVNKCCSDVAMEPISHVAAAPGRDVTQLHWCQDLAIMSQIGLFATKRTFPLPE